MSGLSDRGPDNKEVVQVTFLDGSQRVIDGWITESPDEIIIKHRGRDPVVGNGLITERFFKHGLRSVKTSDARKPVK